MSGGAYNYFSCKDRGDIALYRETLEEVERDIEKYSSEGAPDVRGELKEIGALMDQACDRFERLQHVLYTFEWWMSGDTDESGFDKAVQEWRKVRGDGQKTHTTS